MLTSVPFGEFDPLQPTTLSGIFAVNIYADPVEIEAPVPLVWEIMTRFDLFPEWNPLNRFFHLDTRAAVGETVTFGPSWGPYDGKELPPTHRKQHERLTILQDSCALAYGVISSPLNAERVQYICAIDGGKTRYQTYERMSGLLSPFTRLVYGKRIVAGFTANGIALKARAEAMAKRDPTSA